MDDGILNAYVEYLLVDPAYHKQMIGRTLVDMVKQKYQGYLRVILLAYKTERTFYENCGFEEDEASCPMLILNL